MKEGVTGVEYVYDYGVIYNNPLSDPNNPSLHTSIEMYRVETNFPFVVIGRLGSLQQYRYK